MKNNDHLGKQFTFMKLNRCANINGESYVACTVAGRIMHPTALTTAPGNGKPVISFIIPIQNRSRTIKRFCGAEPSVNETGTTWADVTVWGRQAENFAQYLQRHPRSVIIIVGSMRVEEVLNKQGETYNRVKITMNGFVHQADISPRKKDEIGQDADAESEDIPAGAAPDEAPAAIHEDNVEDLPATPDDGTSVPEPSTAGPHYPDAA